MRVVRLKQRLKHLQNFTGLSGVQFGELFAAFGVEVSYSQVVDKPRQRAVGVGWGWSGALLYLVGD